MMNNTYSAPPLDPRVWRGIIQLGTNLGNSDDQIRCWHSYMDRSLSLDENSRHLHEYLQAWFTGNPAHPPEMELVRQHFESRSLIEVCDYLTEVSSAQQYISSNYAAILDRALETQRQHALNAALRDAAAIAQHGRTQGSGRHKKTLRGVKDAVDYLLTSLPEFGGDGPQDMSIESAIAVATERTKHPRTPTGIAALDSALCGGLPGGNIFVVTAPPGNFKSTMLCYLAGKLAAAGNPVAYMAVDEGRDRAAARLAAAGTRNGPLRMATAEAFIEDQAERVTKAAAKATRDATVEAIMKRPRAIGDEDNDSYIEMRARDWGLIKTGVLVVDSLQCVPCRGAINARDQFARLEAVMPVLRTLTERHGVLILASSEANRGSFSRKNESENSAGLASAKGSSSIEYKADVACTLRKTESGIRLRVEKNRLGPEEPEIYLRWDGQAFTETGVPRVVGDNDEAVVMDVIARVKCSTSRELRVACKDDGRITSYERVQAALTALKLKRRLAGGNGVTFIATDAIDMVAT